MQSQQKGFTVIEALIGFLFICFVPFCFCGYIMNIVKLTRCDFEAPYKSEIIRTIGLVPPIGIVVGYCSITDKKKE
jgi:hypothetical protein